MRHPLIPASLSIGLAALLAGCGGGVDTQPQPVPIATQTIAYETSPCFGTCPVYSVTLSPDGQGRFEGKRFTATTGPASFTATPDQYLRFARLLAPYRPASGDDVYDMTDPRCGTAPTDMPSADVTWTMTDGTKQHLHFYYGCAGAKPDMAKALRAAPDILPIKPLIGGH